MKSKFVELYRDIAERVAQLSTARRARVGSIVVKDDRIISIGYNGTPRGWDNNCEYENFTLGSVDQPKLETRPEVCHAEMNALAKIARSNESAEDADMFVTHGPCMECAKLIYQSGIAKVYYGEPYKDDAGVRFLKQSGVEVIKHGD